MEDSKDLKRKIEDEDPEDLAAVMSKHLAIEREKAGMARQCPYLDTIDRNLLDFDFEKLCSVSLSRINVYACLVCGKYFQGRGQNTHAYTHSVSDEQHQVFLNLVTKKFYCLCKEIQRLRSGSLGKVRRGNEGGQGSHQQVD